MELVDPAWESAFVFAPTLAVRSKSNHRRAPGSSSWGTFRAFEDAVAFDARAALPASWPELAAHLPLARRPAVGLVIVASTTIDATNLPKSIADALEGIAYANDASVLASTSLALRSTRPYAAVALCASTRSPGLEEFARMLHRLTVATVGFFNANAPVRTDGPRPDEASNP